MNFVKPQKTVTEQLNFNVMKKERNWIIVDLETKKALYGVHHITLMFSTKEIAEEVAEQLFDVRSRYVILDRREIGSNTEIKL